MHNPRSPLVQVTESAAGAVHDIWAFTRDDVERAYPDRRWSSAEQARFARPAPWRPAETAAIAVVSRDMVEDFAAALGTLLTEIRLASSAAIVLVPYKQPPITGTRPDGEVTSFLCDAGTFRAIASDPPIDGRDRLCFRVLHGLLNETMRVRRLLVRQLGLVRDGRVVTSVTHQREPDPIPAAAPAAADGPRVSAAPQPRVGVDLLMSHRGSVRHLTTALRSIESADGSSRIAIQVGLDVDDLTPYYEVRAQFPAVRFFQVAPAPAGVFVVRQRLLDGARQDLFALQDTDDVSCSDRFEAQFRERERIGCDLIGCHELRVDELAGTVEAFRLPLDVMDALSRGYSDSLLNGTIVGGRLAALAAGGYSTHHRIANDTQFMLRAYFSLRMGNIDGFHYLRRRHRTALTVAPDTAFGTPLREYLRQTWSDDFDAVRTGRLPLDASSLRRLSTDAEHAIIEWSAADAVVADASVAGTPDEPQAALRRR